MVEAAMDRSYFDLSFLNTIEFECCACHECMDVDSFIEVFDRTGTCISHLI